MRILIPYYSRSGHTEQLALTLASELRRRGHSVVLEKIHVEQAVSKWRLTLPLLSTLPVLPFFLWNAAFRRWWLGRYRQAEQAIAPLDWPDVAQFDRICLGGPKWLYIAYPVARYLEQVRGLAGKPVGVFATFCGPPLAVFELEMLFDPLRRRLENRQAQWLAALAISSHHHEFFFFNEMEWVFRLVSRIAFRRPLQSFTLGSAWGRDQVEQFCDTLCASPPSE